MQKCFQTNNFNVRTKWSLANLSRAIFAARISLWRKLETKVLTLNFGIYIIPHKKRFVPRESSLYQALRHWSSYCNIQNSTLTCHNRQQDGWSSYSYSCPTLPKVVSPPCTGWLVGLSTRLESALTKEFQISKTDPRTSPFFVDWFELSSLQMFW